MRILVLVGPKGSGKTFIGRSIEEEHQKQQQKKRATFLEIEMIAKEFLANIGGTAASWKEEAFRASFFEQVQIRIEELAKTALKEDDDVIIFETTGAAPETKKFLDNLNERFGGRGSSMHLIRIRSSPSTCAKRIQTRDSSRQVDVPLEMIQQMHTITDTLDWNWDLELINDDENDGGHGLSKENIWKSVEKLLN